MTSRARNRSAMIDRMARRVVRRFRPERVILFGSHARGEANADSDVDLLVVLPVEGSKREMQIEIRMALDDLRVANDVVVSTPEDFAWRKDVVGTIEYPAAHGGRVLYERR
jgi:predicted nucleotidyltransferase